MKRIYKLILLWILFYIPFVIAFMGGFFYLVKYKNQPKNEKTRNLIGEKIDFGYLIDLNNNKVKLNYTTDFTIIDFWYKGCSPCLEEMKRFSPLLNGNEDKITIISISIEDVKNWMPIFEDNSPYPFLNKRISNWKHYAVADTIYVDNINRIVKKNGSSFLREKLGINTFPAYLVLDKSGVLIDRPVNAVNYLKKVVYNQSEFRIFWSSEKFKRQRVSMLSVGFGVYSLLYWLIIGISLLIRRIKKRYFH